MRDKVKIILLTSLHIVLKLIFIVALIFGAIFLILKLIDFLGSLNKITQDTILVVILGMLFLSVVICIIYGLYTLIKDTYAQQKRRVERNDKYKK